MTRPLWLPGRLGDYPDLAANYIVDMARRFGADLTNAPLQGSFVVSFALPVEAITYTELLSTTHWTNHPEWVMDTYTTTQSSAETGESLTWYVLELWRRQIYLPLVLR